MTKLSKKRLQELAGIKAKSTINGETELSKEDSEVLQEGMRIFGMASPGVLGNPFGTPELHEQPGDDSPASRMPSREDEEEGRLDLADIDISGDDDDIRSRGDAEGGLVAQMLDVHSKLMDLGDTQNAARALELANAMKEEYNVV